MKAQNPLAEAERIQALYSLAILDTDTEESYDDIVKIAANLCEVPTALISLIDVNRQWFKARVGMGVNETHRDQAFCAHAILEPQQVLVVEDAQRDARFSDNPLVTGAPGIRFYAGAPLVNKSGLALGTLCVIDYQSRPLTQAQSETLKKLSRQVIRLFELRAANKILKENSEKLQEIEQRWQSMFKNFPGVVYRRNNDALRTMFYISKTVELLTGYPTNSFYGAGAMSLSDLTHPEDIELVNEAMQGSLSTQKAFDVVYRLKNLEGNWRWVQERGAGIYDDAGTLKYIDGFIWDVTDTQRTYRAIALNEKKLSTLYKLSPVAISLNRYDDGAFIEGNPELFRMTGYSAEEFKQLGVWDLTPHHYAEQQQLQWTLLKNTGRYGPYEKHYIHKDGHLIPVLLTGVLIEASRGELQIWSIIQDITERKRIELMKNEFVSAVSHELRTPLTSISGSLGLICSGKLGTLPEKVNVMLDIANKNAQRLTWLINDLLDMEKLVAGQMMFDIKIQPLVPLVEQTLLENKVYAERYSVDFVLINKLLEHEIAVDALRLQQVLTNFLSNAVKFSPPNSQVKITLENIGAAIKIGVTDCGPGISDEFRSRIFQKFSQADASDSRQKGGTGLGLAISKELVERMQGEIGFTSEPGQGATFFVVFPASQC